MRVVFDTRELYFLTQYLPVYRALRKRGADCRFVAYHNRPTMLDGMRKAFERWDLPVEWCETREDGLAYHQREKPDWIFFGNAYGYHDALPRETRSAMLFHGIGMKLSKYAPGLMVHDVRFIEGPFYERKLRAMYPEAELRAVGHAKLDPLFGPAEDRPRFDLEAAGLDPAKRTLLYAPTHSPSSFPRMSPDWPEHFRDFNLLVKPHYLSHFGGKRRRHRELMSIWSEAPNVYVAPIDSWDPLPFMAAADLLISDVSAMALEFAAMDKPVVWNDFLKVHWTRRGPLRYRLWLRMDRELIDTFGDVAAHARRYKDLHRVVEGELERPERLAAARACCRDELIGPTDGRVSERIADYLFGEATSASVETVA